MSIKKIACVTKVTAVINKPNLPHLLVTVSGEASSGSHSSPRFERREYVVFPEDGIQEYDFTVEVPVGPVTTNIKEHTVDNEWEGFPPEINVVRIYAKNNSMEAAIT